MCGQAKSQVIEVGFKRNAAAGCVRRIPAAFSQIESPMLKGADGGKAALHAAMDSDRQWHWRATRRRQEHDGLAPQPPHDCDRLIERGVLGRQPRFGRFQHG